MVNSEFRESDRKLFGEIDSIIVGLDIGASLAKGIIVDMNLRIKNRHILPVEKPETTAMRLLEILLRNYRKTVIAIAASGGGSRLIGDVILSLPVKKVDEIKAIGLGGLLSADMREGLVVSAGTGTALVAAYDGGNVIKHVGGTGVGGGTIMGLSRRILGVNDFETLENMALKGNINEVDLTVGDIVGGPIGIIPAEATASNLGKLTLKSNENDVAAGILNVVSQTIGVVAAMAAKACHLENNVILIGMLAKSKVVSKIICETTGLFGVKVFIPENCEFSNALGAAAAVLKEMDLLHK
ncbi:MAG: hypothetical protein QXG34_03600 [Candidatus Bathyarchaeia archaeon]